AGLMPLTFPEYGFLGFKCKLLFESLASNGRVTTLVEECKLNGLLEIQDKEARKNRIDSILKEGNYEFSEEDKQRFSECIEGIVFINPAMQKKINETNTLANELKHLQVAKQCQPSDPAAKLQKALTMFSDPKTPITFPANKRQEAIVMYNHMSQLFDDYNQEALTGKHLPIDKRDFLNAFRKQYCTVGSNNALRLLSGLFPIVLLRMAWRELRLSNLPVIGDQSPYNRDRIHASQEKDVLLRYQLLGLVTNMSYAFMNLLNRVIKFSVGVIPYTAIRIAYARDPEGGVARINQLGKSLDDTIGLQNLLSRTVPFARTRARMAGAAHEVSSYCDVVAAGKAALGNVEKNTAQAVTIRSVENAKPLRIVESKLTVLKPEVNNPENPSAPRFGA
ncbi:MAG: hypothetical protein B7X00_01000, partial [Legionella sp. 21-45-4]